MLVIRLFRIGKRNQPSFKIVVTDKKRPTKAGRFVEEVGNCNPLTKEKAFKKERVKYWLSVGAKPSPTVFNLLISEKIIEGKKIPVHKKKKVKESASAPAGATAGQVEKPKTEEKPIKEPPKEEVPKTETPTPAEKLSVTEPPQKEEPKSEASKEEIKEAPETKIPSEEAPGTEEKK